ncbi:MAG TPA: fibronectin type III-like domain-contianing protein, partial [Chitinophagaceae bacterium]
ISKGNEQVVEFKIPVQELQKWDLQQHQWKLYPGEYTVLIGSNSQNIKLRSTITVKPGIK